MSLFTDSESTLESVASSKQIVTKTLRMTIVDLKERLIKGGDNIGLLAPD